MNTIPKNFKIVLRHKWWLSGLSVLCVLLLFGPTVYAKISTSAIRYNANTTPFKDIPYRPVALVFGAGLYDGNKPTLYLRNRVKTAVDLFMAGRVDHLVMTGDNGRTNYDEPTAMKKYAVSLGMHERDITLDYAGFDTYDSCYRAKAIFQLKSVLVVTQGYHLPRAVMTCTQLGLNAIGVAAENTHAHDWKVNYILREWIATGKALFQLIIHSKPTVLGPQVPIDHTRQ